MSDTISSLLQRIRNYTGRVDDSVELAEAALVRLADVREAAEAQKAEHSEGDFYYSWDTKRQCNRCTSYWPCREYQRAEAILGVVGEQTTTKDHT